MEDFRKTKAQLIEELKGFRTLLAASEITESSNQRLKQEFQSSKHLCQALMQNLPLGIFIINTKGKIVDTNPALQKIFDSPGTNFTDTLTELISTLILPEIQRFLTNGELKTSEHRYISKWGKEVYIKLILVPIRGIECRGSWVLGIVEDLTESKSAKEALEKSEEVYRSVVQYSLDVISILDENGVINFISPSTHTVLGYHEIDLIGRNIFEFICSDDAPTVRAVIGELMEHPGSTGHVELHFRHADGSWIYLESVGSNLLDDPNIMGIIVSSRDITKRRLAEEALRVSEMKYHRLVDNLGDGIVMVDANGQFTFANPAAEDLFGVVTGGLEGRRLQDFMESGQYEIWQHQIELRRSGKQDAFEVTIQRFGDVKRLIRVSATPEVNLAGELVGTLGVFRDITSYRELETQFQQSQKMEAIGTLAGGVAHDFNNLLTAISGNVELVQSSLSQNNPLWPDIEEIRKAALSAEKLTKQLLAFSRKQAMAPKILNLNSVIIDMDRILSRIIGEDIQLVTNLAPNLWMVKADPGQMEQVILNLAVNARDAMPGGGKLIIETVNEVVDEQRACARTNISPGFYVTMSVSDTGCGMTQEVMARIFDPFFTTKEVGKGTGLGLSTVYGIVKQSGGGICVHSVPQQGTTFKIGFPKVEGGVEKFMWKPESSEVPRGTESILVVEDEEVVRNLTVRILKQQGYHVLKADNGEEAYQLCRQMEKPVDLVITDVIMPRMDGLMLAERLKELWTGIKILFVSGYTANAIVHHGVIDPDKPYLQKPFRLSALAWKVREVLED